MKKAVGYIRSAGDTEQQELIREYCMKVDMQVVEWKTAETDGAVGKVAYGNWLVGQKIDAVVVADSADVSEDVYEFYAYKAVLKRRHSDLLAVKSRFAGYDLYRKLFDGLIEAMCRIDLENEPLKKAHDRTDKAARGAYIGGNAPMGYKVERGKLVINPEEVPVVLCVMDRKHTGKTMLSTVDALNRDGYKSRSGKPFVISTVSGIWKNEMFYRGFYRHGKDGEWVKGQHEPILKE